MSNIGSAYQIRTGDFLVENQVCWASALTRQRKWRCQRELNPRFRRDRATSVPLDHGTKLKTGSLGETRTLLLGLKTQDPTHRRRGQNYERAYFTQDLSIPLTALCGPFYYHGRGCL